MQPTMSASHPSHCSVLNPNFLLPRSYPTLRPSFLPRYLFLPFVSSCYSVLVLMIVVLPLLVFLLFGSAGYILSLVVLLQAIRTGSMSGRCPWELLHYIASRVSAVVSYITAHSVAYVTNQVSYGLEIRSLKWTSLG